MPTPEGQTRTVLVLSDSLAFHGPERAELTTDARLWPNVMAAELGRLRGHPYRAVIYGRRGWTTRDGWFALTKDPYLYSELAASADLIVIALGGMDYLPAVLPAHLREGLRLVRPEPLRRLAVRALAAVQPPAARLTRGRVRTLSTRTTAGYLTRCLSGLQLLHPDTELAVTVPPLHAAPSYGRVTAGQAGAARLTLEVARELGVHALRHDEWVAPFVAAGELNPDGIHWTWPCHAVVGSRSAASLTGAAASSDL